MLAWYQMKYPPSRHPTWKDNFYKAAERGDKQWLLERCKSSRFRRSTFVRYCLLRSAVVREDFEEVKDMINNMQSDICKVCFLNRFNVDTSKRSEILGEEIICTSHHHL